MIKGVPDHIGPGPSLRQGPDHLGALHSRSIMNAQAQPQSRADREGVRVNPDMKSKFEIDRYRPLGLVANPFALSDAVSEFDPHRPRGRVAVQRAALDARCVGR